MLCIKHNVYEELIQHCKTSIPNEACGILAGSTGLATKIYKMKNISEDPVHCYFMEPKEQLTIFKDMRKEGIELVAIYHSHPATAPYPSKRDIELAFYPEAFYVIVSFADGKEEIGVYKIAKDKIEKVEWKVVL